MSYCVQTSRGVIDESVSHEEPPSRISDLSSLSQDDESHLASYSSDDDEAAQEQVSIQQERLLQLRHTLNCPHRAMTCPVSRHCGNMRMLWRHMLRCKAEFCSFPYCISSRFLLQHYRSCPKDTCAVCRPVRDTYKRPRSETEEREILESTPNKRRRISSSSLYGFPQMSTFSAFSGAMQSPMKIEDGYCGVEPMLRSIALDDSPRSMRTADH